MFVSEIDYNIYMAAQETGKFIFLESIDKFLLESGLNRGMADVITFVVALLILLFLIWVIKIIGSHIISALMQAAIRRTGKQWDEYLLKRKFYDRLVRFCASLVIMAATPTLFQGFSTQILNLAETIIAIYIVFTGLQVFNSIMNTVNDVYETKPQARQKSIRSIIQSANIVAAVIAVILVISIVLRQNPKDLLVALGASAAIISLVFRDTILGFVASIQISAQEMIHPGDWVEMPSRGANGMVSEINVMNVKIRNWDNSVSMIPTYAIISESFTNWRSMQESEGRRFQRPLLIDINCVATLNRQQIDKIVNHPVINKDIAADMLEIMNEGNTSGFITNIGLYRSYIEALIKQHPSIAENLRRVVRYLDNSEFGITLQIYAFSKEKNLHEYERVISDIFENVMVVAPLFGIKMYQRPAYSREDSASENNIHHSGIVPESIS